MQDFWNKISQNYWNANDLEEKQRLLLASFLLWKEWNLIELACWNWKVIQDILLNNKDLNIIWIDYNASMIEEAKNRIKWVNFINWNILEIEKIIWNKKFDYVVCLNSIHNLPNIELINIFFEKMKLLVNKNWYIIFDIRNKFNPFINFWYYQNRQKWIDFFTLNKYKILKKFREDFEIILDKWITYNNLNEYWKINLNIILKTIYYIYLKVTKINLVSPYQFIILRKK